MAEIRSDTDMLAELLHDAFGIRLCPSGVGHNGWYDCPSKDWWIEEARFFTQLGVGFMGDKEYDYVADDFAFDSAREDRFR